MDLSPFLLGAAPTMRPLVESCPAAGLAVFDVLAPEGLPIFQLLNAANGLVYGDLAMAPWAQLDCCALPSALIGYAAPRAAVEEPLWRDLLAQLGERFGEPAARALDGYQGLVPLSEYCALPTPEPGVVVGMSLLALRRGLGVRTKALALACHRARRQIGIAQYGNRAVRAHVAFGDLAVVCARARAHSRPDETFVYQVELDGDRLQALARGERPPDSSRSEWTLPLDGRTGERVEQAMAAGRRVRVVAPGSDGATLHLAG